ncbi:PTS ascorbate transporter subunit IIB [Erysipelothrix larvae]|uniref:PTS ascorbate transporter subunit IIB n=1 Tax=Erysipelothrix larvae TaxID=1514105 RepID=A0A0X8H1F6_9FIRM|nr:PTS sugar transporter subunit IIB [Erysipelothrix larvae]AMC94347.1 PTS ascorbate transporter subunit IIB [Erysipelothrix larvae]
MYNALVCCRAGMGSSMLLKIKVDQVIKEKGYPIKTEHGNLDSLVGFKGDLVITMDDLTAELSGKVPYALGIRNIVNKEEINEKLEEFLKTKE